MDPVDWSSFVTAVHNRRRFYRVYLDPRVPCPNYMCRPHRTARLYITYVKGQRYATLRCSCKCATVERRMMWNCRDGTRCAHWCRPLPMSDEMMAFLQGSKRHAPSAPRTVPFEGAIEALWKDLKGMTLSNGKPVPSDAAYSIQHAIALQAFINGFRPLQENPRQSAASRTAIAAGAVGMDAAQRHKLAESHMDRNAAQKRVRE